MLSTEDSFNGPRDFKQCRNIAYNTKIKERKTSGKGNNFADELVACMSLVDNHEYVHPLIKVKGQLPSFILYTEDQIDDMKYFIKKQKGYAL